MHTFLSLLFVLMSVFTSCSEENVVLSLDNQTLNFSVNGEVKVLTITSNSDWEIINTQNWISVRVMKGTGNAKVVISTNENKGVGVRQANVVVKSGSKEVILTVTQGGQMPYLLFSPLQISGRATGGEYVVTIDANGAYEVAIPTQDSSWLSVKNKTNTQFTLVLDPNPLETIRESNIALKLIGSTISQSLVVSQNAALKPNTINLSNNDVSFPAAGGELSIDVEANVIWDIYIPAGTSWITLKSKSAGNVKLTLAPNYTSAPRSSKITFRNDEGSAISECLISQATDGYTMTADMSGDDGGILNLTNWNAVDTYMKGFGYEYTEHPEACNTPGYAHLTMPHCTPVYDATLHKNVFRFDIHVTPFLDRDRCTIGTYDRQRNEMKTQTNNTTWSKVQGNYDEWQILEWKFKLNAGLKPSNSFFHIHQLKAQDGTDNGAPLITITPRATNRIQIIHTARSGGHSLGTVVDNANLSEYLDEWVQVHEEMHYNIVGSYKITITRIRDNKVLMSYETNNIDLWRKGSSFIRNKYGLYRSLGGDVPINVDGSGIPPNGIKNESMWVTDFKIFEKNPNPNPSQPHD
ncbi:MAG TPA: BACON domain-containing protein [Bacteroidales bacterium]|nr:BACON domain-containing protein [Bacteroidales bacterium]